MAAPDETRTRLREVRAAVDRLERLQRELERALDEIDHQLRRVSDRIERDGAGGAAEADRRRLRENRGLNQGELEAGRRQLEALRDEAAALEARLARRE